MRAALCLSCLPTLCRHKTWQPNMQQVPRAAETSASSTLAKVALLFIHTVNTDRARFREMPDESERRGIRRERTEQ